MTSLPSFTDLPIADITVLTDRLRPLSEAKVAALLQVIGEAGWSWQFVSKPRRLATDSGTSGLERV